MTSAIEHTVKALIEFESALDSAKADVSEAKKKATKDATDWAEAAKNSAIAEANEIAARRVAEAKVDAEAEAKRIREKGDSALREFESLISQRGAVAASFAASRLLGESK